MADNVDTDQLGCLIWVYILCSVLPVRYGTLIKSTTEILNSLLNNPGSEHDRPSVCLIYMFLQFSHVLAPKLKTGLLVPSLRRSRSMRSRFAYSL